MFVVKRASPFYCQIRVDFKSFNVGGPDQNGICTNGWNVTGQADTNVPTICGLNDGQHVYLNFDNFTPIKMTINFNDSDDWAIKVTQIKCNDQENLAPTGCLQYFPEASGQVESFNFQTVSSVAPVTSTQTTYQLANLDYYACIGTSTNTYSQITWTKGVGTTNYYFVLTSNVALIPSNFVGTAAAAEYNGDCTGTGSPTNDYVEIIDGTFTDIDGTSRTETQFCGLHQNPSDYM
ncbi:hypothetical protein Anas_12849 [Armadillidium nasatum]|uniref:CUB domain-containing protein n=1 Tax=Armadillidium nasatum TaxID=96803 RepID=A0A5N5T0T6_9CRUS|nr:hypothetical protein Anas_12849 [Armadillidium nasatum]